MEDEIDPKNKSSRTKLVSPRVHGQI